MDKILGYIKAHGYSKDIVKVKPKVKPKEIPDPPREIRTMEALGKKSGKKYTTRTSIGAFTGEIGFKKLLRISGDSWRLLLSS